MTKRRMASAGWMAGTILLGLLSRRFAALLPWWLAKNAGDVLYATMANWLMGFLFPTLPPGRVFAVAVAFCFSVEFSQLDQAAWLLALRRTQLGGLVLGHGFHVLDLACYVLGALLGLAIASRLPVAPPTKGAVNDCHAGTDAGRSDGVDGLREH